MGTGNHNATTCPNIDRCIACHKPEHNAQTCPTLRRCSICHGANHDARNCPMKNKKI